MMYVAVKDISFVELIFSGGSEVAFLNKTIERVRIICCESLLIVLFIYVSIYV